MPRSPTARSIRRKPHQRQRSAPWKSNTRVTIKQPLPPSETLTLFLGAKLRKFIETCARHQGLAAPALLHRLVAERFGPLDAVLNVDVDWETLQRIQFNAVRLGMTPQQFVSTALRLHLPPVRL